MSCNKQRLLTGLALGMPLFCSMPASAQSELSWNGFFTTGIVASNRSEVYSDGVTKQPSLSDQTLLGINLARELTPSTRVAAQLVAKGGNADTALKADWVFVSIRPVESVSVTAGKQSIPIWMVSQYMDVGTAYPWARPPEEVYKIFDLKSFTGVRLRYSLALAGGTLSIAPYGGETVLESAPNAPTKDTKIEGENMFGGEVLWTNQATTVRAGYNRARWDLSFGELGSLGERHFELWSVGFSTKVHGVVAMGEYAGTRDLDEKKFLDLADDEDVEAGEAEAAGDDATAGKLRFQATLNRARLGGAKAYYLTTGYEFSPFGLFLTYADLKKPVLPPLKGDQRSVALTGNYDLNEDSVIKLEAKRLSIPDESRGLFKGDGLEAPDGIDGAMLYRLNYNVVF